MLFHKFLVVVATLTAQALGQCTRDALKTAGDTYVLAQSGGQTTAFADIVSYSENFKTLDVKTGILSKALKIDHNRTIYDTTTCATYTELIITDTTHPYVIGTQIHYNSSSISATRIEVIITDAGDWAFNAKDTLKWAVTESWTEIPVAKRDSRAVIQAAADAYCDVFNDKNVKVPWGTPCARLEGGSYTGSGKPTDKCDVGIPSGVQITNRRYVIDEILGTVDVFNTFAGNLPDTHEFRIEEGKIRYVHTMTVMS